MQKRDRLSFRIPWLLEAVAEGPLAIITLFALALIVIVTKSLGWW
jgi:hypothetical protein